MSRGKRRSQKKFEKSIKIRGDEKFLEKFNAIKEYFSLENDSEVLRVAVALAYKFLFESEQGQKAKAHQGETPK